MGMMGTWKAGLEARPGRQRSLWGADVQAEGL